MKLNPSVLPSESLILLQQKTHLWNFGMPLDNFEIFIIKDESVIRLI